MKHRIEHILDIKVIGMHDMMPFITIGPKTGALARQFMPRRHEVVSRIGKHVFSIQNYNERITAMTPNLDFQKWVGVEVTNFNDVPEDMDTFTIKGGTYAVFTYKGSVQDFSKSRQYIFEDWLPNSNYELDTRAHFEILNENYSKDLQNIEEDVWVSVK
ncbi:GyrI-like domain-containing protein [Ichthyenterobacterium magnum]|uniref:AraC family transcriptional regulator n=1 Tax=Ichthyenterobacterium magnum TaxID=1230530 RepID=A0A420DFA6_9FLAO|nr:GyrI-like domain-containing protein [Ichthyenterobacterium magnum]RKE91900.1 AraC family transcriptional regulator [Ichthyenterobacterium magnum]